MADLEYFGDFFKSLPRLICIIHPSFWRPQRAFWISPWGFHSQSRANQAKCL